MSNNQNGSWYARPSEDVLSELESTAEGLSGSEADDRLQRYGENRIQSRGATSKLKIFLSQLSSPLVYILLVAMGVTLAIQHWADSIVIGIVLIAAIFHSFSASQRGGLKTICSSQSPKSSVR